jgi:hypothetical protein
VTFAGDLDALCKVEEQVTGAKQSASRVALGQEAAHLGEGTMNVQRTDGCEEREFVGHVVLQGQHLVRDPPVKAVFTSFGRPAGERRKAHEHLKGMQTSEADDPRPKHALKD